MDEHTLTPAQRFRPIAELRQACAPALAEWLKDPKCYTMWSLRGCVTRLLSIVLTGIDVPKQEADQITAIYLRRFGEFSMFAHFAPFMLALLGTEEITRRDVFLPLRRRGLDPLQVDMVLFAGMFSVGTIVMKCVDNTRVYDVDYGKLDLRQRIAFVVESIRLWPTVSTAHRIIEEPEEVMVAGRRIVVNPGQEIAYPFVSINRDPSTFSEPEKFRLDRSDAEVAEILSWSRGEHVCPARDISINVTVIMLDALQEAAGDLRRLDIDNIEL
jgi:hypothetical protein